VLAARQFVCFGAFHRDVLDMEKLNNAIEKRRLQDGTAMLKACIASG
jgi:hypothetical protein